MRRAALLVPIALWLGCSSTDTVHETSPESGGAADTSTAVKDSTASTDAGPDAQAADGPQEAPSDDVEDLGKRKDGATADAGDGAVALTGKLKWAEGFGTTGNTEANSVTSDPSGNWLVGGDVTGSADFGGGALDCGPDGGLGDCMFVAKYGSAGAYSWAKLFRATEPAGSSVTPQVSGGVIGSDAAGNVYLAAFITGSINLGGGRVKGPKQGELFIVKLSPAGEYVWATPVSPLTLAGKQCAAVDPSGDVFLAGGFKGSVGVGGGLITGTGKSNLYVAEIDPSGAYMWGESFAATGQWVYCETLALDPVGDVLVGGMFDTSLDLGGGKLKSGAAAPAMNAFLAKYSSTGAYAWAEVFTDGLQDEVTGVATDSVGDVYLTGTFAGSIDLGTGDLPSAGGADVFLGKLDPSGVGIWSATFGDSNDQLGGPIAVNGLGDVTIGGGCYSGSINFGGGALACNGGGADTAMFIATFDTGGAYAWAYTAGSTVSGVLGLAVDPSSNVACSGFFAGKLTLGGKAVTAPSSVVADALVAEFAP